MCMSLRQLWVILIRLWLALQAPRTPGVHSGFPDSPVETSLLRTDGSAGTSSLPASLSGAAAAAGRTQATASEPADSMPGQEPASDTLAMSRTGDDFASASSGSLPEEGSAAAASEWLRCGSGSSNGGTASSPSASPTPPAAQRPDNPPTTNGHTEPVSAPPSHGHSSEICAIARQPLADMSKPGSGVADGRLGGKQPAPAPSQPSTPSQQPQTAAKRRAPAAWPMPAVAAEASDDAQAGQGAETAHVSAPALDAAVVRTLSFEEGKAAQSGSDARREQELVCLRARLAATEEFAAALQCELSTTK